MTTEQDLNAIYLAKVSGMSDQDIMRCFSVSLREIEKAIIRNTGTNLNLYNSRKEVSNLGPTSFWPEASTVWSFKNRGSWATHTGDYRGNWSPYIPRNVILRYSVPGSLVLDQFCGAGTTAVEAKLLGRRCIARDISPAAVALARRNLDFRVCMEKCLDDGEPQLYEPVVEVGDARTLCDIQKESVDLVCTHPPYADIVHYTDGLEGDLSFHSVDEFIEDMKLVAGECFRVLKPGAICAILIGDARKNKMVVPIGFRTIETFLDRGFVLKDLIIKRQHNCRTNGYWYSSSIKYNFLLLAQEYLPIFLKPSRPRNECRTGTHRVKHSVTTIAERTIAPEKMECKTMWVLAANDYESHLEGNLFSRYGENGIIVRVKFSKTGYVLKTPPEQWDLLYVDGPETGVSSSADLESIGTALADLLADYSCRVRQGGHLVIRTKDLRVGDCTLSTALKAWRLPDESFKIREVVVVTSDTSVALRAMQSDLEISHEYLLVYQKV